MNRFDRLGALLILAFASSLLTQCGGESTHLQSTAPKALPFIQDDYPQALAQARQQKLPLFIESWALW